jgi:hypothetical protein
VLGPGEPVEHRGEVPAGLLVLPDTGEEHGDLDVTEQRPHVGLGGDVGVVGVGPDLRPGRTPGSPVTVAATGAATPTTRTAPTTNVRTESRTRTASIIPNHCRSDASGHRQAHDGH